MAIPEDCLTEARVGEKTLALLNASSISPFMRCEDYGNLKKLLRVTAYVLKFIANTKSLTRPANQGNSTLTAGDVEVARRYWLQISQKTLPETRNFEQWKAQFGLFQDEFRLWRCGGRLGNSDIPPRPSTQCFWTRNTTSQPSLSETVTKG